MHVIEKPFKTLPCRYFLIPGNFPRGWLDICQIPFSMWFFESQQRCTLFQHSNLNEKKLFKMHSHDISIEVPSCKIFLGSFFIRSLPKLVDGFQIIQTIQMCRKQLDFTWNSMKSSISEKFNEISRSQIIWALYVETISWECWLNLRQRQCFQIWDMI